MIEQQTIEHIHKTHAADGESYTREFCISGLNYSACVKTNNKDDCFNDLIKYAIAAIMDVKKIEKED